MKKVAIIQSNYIPWKGYFDIIASVDLFIFHDDVQYTKNDWRNRNKIKTPNGTRWITIPCGINKKREICEVKLSDFSWQEKHWNLIKSNYSKAPYFKYYRSFFEKIYKGCHWNYLSELNQFMIKNISRELLGLTTKFDDSRNYKLIKKKEDRVIELLKKVGATTYLSGPAAKSYISYNKFISEGIKLDWMDYSNYPEYIQIHPPFEHSVSILDLLFNVGPSARKFMLLQL